MKNFIRKELSPIWLLISAIILICLLIILGVIHLIVKGIYESFQKKFWNGIIYLVKYILNVTYQIWVCVKYLFLQTAIAIDLFGNVVCGEAIEDLVTYEEKTMYGKGDVTVSTATGEMEVKGKLNKLGLRFSKVLSKILDENHCVNSYKRHLHNQKFEL